MGEQPNARKRNGNCWNSKNRESLNSEYLQAMQKRELKTESIPGNQRRLQRPGYGPRSLPSHNALTSPTGENGRDGKRKPTCPIGRPAHGHHRGLTRLEAH